MSCFGKNPMYERALDMWAAGDPPWEICDATNYATPEVLRQVVFRARQLGDPRAIRRGRGKSRVRGRIVHLVKAGCDCSQIAERLGISQKNVRVQVSHARRYGELPKLPPRPRYTYDRASIVSALVAGRLSFGKIAVAHCVSKNVVSSIARKVRAAA